MSAQPTEFEQVVRAAYDHARRMGMLRVGAPADYIVEVVTAAHAAEVRAAESRVLERAKEIVATAERMAWSDEEGSTMNVAVFERNFNVDIAALTSDQEG